MDLSLPEIMKDQQLINQPTRTDMRGHWEISKITFLLKQTGTHTERVTSLKWNGEVRAS